jgi:hypothetical protein
MMKSPVMKTHHYTARVWDREKREFDELAISGFGLCLFGLEAIFTRN